MARGTWWSWFAMWFATPTPVSGKTLMEASQLGDYPIVKELLLGGVLPDRYLGPNGESALWLAADNGHTISAKHLLDMGADPGLDDRDGASPLTQAAAHGHRKIIEHMALDNPHAFKQQSAALGLWRAAENGHAEAIRALLQGGTPADLRARGHPTALLAAAARDGACVAVLLEGGADVHQKDPVGLTALHHAALHNVHAAIRVLLAQGADPAAKDMAGRVPIDLVGSRVGERLLTPLASPQRPLEKSSGEIEKAIAAPKA